MASSPTSIRHPHRTHGRISDSVYRTVDIGDDLLRPVNSIPTDGAGPNPFVEEQHQRVQRVKAAANGDSNAHRETANVHK